MKFINILINVFIIITIIGLIVAISNLWVKNIIMLSLNLITFILNKIIFRMLMEN